MDHPDDDQEIERLATDTAHADPGWDRRWRLAQALMPGRAPSWTALAASGALLLVAAALLVVSVASGHRWMLLLVLAVFAIGMQPVARSTRGHRSRSATAARPGGRNRPGN